MAKEKPLSLLREVEQQVRSGAYMTPEEAREKAVQEATSQAKEEFAVARQRLLDLGVISAMAMIAEILPFLKFEFIGDFEKAGGKGMPPKATLTQNGTRVVEGGYNIFRQKSLSVYPLVFDPEYISVSAWETRRKEYLDGHVEPSGYSLRNGGTDNERMLGGEILEGLKRIVDLDLNQAIKVGHALRGIGIKKEPQKP